MKLKLWRNKLTPIDILNQRALRILFHAFDYLVKQEVTRENLQSLTLVHEMACGILNMRNRNHA